MLKKIFSVVNQLLQFCAGLGFFAVFCQSVYLTFKEGSFIKMIFMIVVPVLSQVYYFIECWCRYGFLNGFGVLCMLAVLLSVLTVLIILLSHIVDTSDDGLNASMGKRVIFGAATFLAIVGCCALSLYLFKNSHGMHTSRDAGPITKAFNVKFGSAVDHSFKSVLVVSAAV